MVSVGDILEYSWGYDQTNVDFFQVVKVSGSSLRLRPIQSKVSETGFMSGNSVPLKGVWKKNSIYPDEFTKRYKVDDEWGVVVKMDYGIATLWDGKPQRTSWYG